MPISTLCGAARRFFRAVLLASTLGATLAWAQAEPVAAEAQVPPATLRVMNRDIMTMRGSLAGAPPAVRAERALERISAIPRAEVDQSARALPFTLGETKGAQIYLGDRLLFSVLQSDLEPESRQSFDQLVKQTLDALSEARSAWHDTQDAALLLRGALRGLALTAGLAVLLWTMRLLLRKTVTSLRALQERMAASQRAVDWREFGVRLLIRTVNLVSWAVVALLLYLWLGMVLGSFVATVPLAHQLGDWLWGKVVWTTTGVLASIPGFVTIVIVLVLARAITDVLRYFFDAVHAGRLRVPMLHPDTTSATRRMVTSVVWALAIAIAYPYLPGAHSEAFKGISVLFGVMVTFGATGLATQAMSGLVLIYARALNKGDFVDINGLQGEVTEVATLATKLITLRNEEVTIPNAVLVASPILNHTRNASGTGVLLTIQVTIGYDAPWRLVHEMLLAAGQATQGVLKQPPPRVYQRALSDFYVEYELQVRTREPMEQVAILSELYGHIQDLFNENGVQILSPHFMEGQAEPVVVPRDKWFTPLQKRPV